MRWEDIDLEEGTIEVNHTLAYYSHGGNGCYFSIHTPKTVAGNRLIPMLDDVKEAFLEEKRYQEYNGLKCNVVIDGYPEYAAYNHNLYAMLGGQD